MRVVIYARTSTKGQDQGLESQIEACKKYCEVRNLSYDVIKDRAATGANANRPGLKRLMSDVCEGKYDMVIVFSFSRFARSVYHLLEALRVFNERDVGFVSLTENLDTKTPMGKALFTIIGALGELDRQLKVEAIKNGVHRAMERGEVFWQEKRYTEEDAAEMKRLWESGVSQTEIAKRYGCAQAQVSRYIHKMHDINKQKCREKRLKASMG